MKLFFIKFLLAIHLCFLLVSGVHGSLFDKNNRGNNPYCATPGECGLDQGIESVRDGLDELVTDRPLSEYIQDVVQFLLGFLSIIAILYIIYAGFVLLTSAGDDERMKTTKNTMIYVIIGLAIIYLAGPITTFVFRVLNSA